jgi:Trehalose utilisation
MLIVMVRHVIAIALMIGACSVQAAEVLIIADEFPAMQTVAAKLKSEENVNARIIAQKELPTSITEFSAVMVYIHGALSPEVEEACIDYTKAGGKLVLLHHSISSGKRKNAHWFSFLGIELPEGEVGKGGYKWIEGVKWDLVNLNPKHFIMTNKVVYTGRINYRRTNAPASGENLAGFTLEHSEVYLNHKHVEPRTLLMGLKFEDQKTGQVYTQETAGWVKPAEKGVIIYLMPGHTTRDFENEAYGRIVLNAVIYQP